MPRPFPAASAVALLPVLAAVTSLADPPRYTVPRLGEPVLGSAEGLFVDGATTALAWAMWSSLQVGYDYGPGLADRASRVYGAASLGLGLPAGFEAAMGWTAGGIAAASETVESDAPAVPDGGLSSARSYRGLGDTGFGPGDLRLALLWSRQSPGHGGFSWLMGFEATWPTGDHDLLLGEGGFTWQPFVAAAFEAFGARIVGNLGYRLRPEHVTVIDGRRFEQDDEVTWGLGIRVVRENDIAWSIEAAGAVGTATTNGPWPRAESRPVLAGGGVDWPVTRLWRLGLFAAFGLAGEEPPLFTAGLRGFNRPLERDEDLDGIPWWKDACPLLPGPESNRGCPVMDSDGDGFPDDEDACPHTPAGPFSEDGC